MLNNDYKTSDQLVELINNPNGNCNSRLEYYKKILLNCSSDILFQNMLNTIHFKDIVSLPKNNNMYRFVIKCNSNSTNVIIGPVNSNVNITEYSDLSNLSIPMSHYHLSKSNFVQDNFVYRISDNVSEPVAKFIERIKFIDNRIKMLIADYIKRADLSSPIANLLRKNNVSFDKNWNYTGIINESKGVEYINIRYFKDSFNKKSIIGTNIYKNNKPFDSLAELLSRNSFFYVKGDIYPIIKINYVLINERIVNGVPMVNFTCKAYFVDMIFTTDNIQCNTVKK